MKRKRKRESLGLWGNDFEVRKFLHGKLVPNRLHPRNKIRALINHILK